MKSTSKSIAGARRSFYGMRARCNNPNHEKYEFYGGRGIKVCAEWSTFDAFLRDMGPRPEGCSIDRIDSSGDYVKDNCRWLPNESQSRNRRSNRWLCIDGERMLLCDAAERFGVKRETIARRLNTGYSDAEAVSKVLPKRSRRMRGCDHRVEIDGEVKSLAEWARVYGKPYSMVHQRVKLLGWDAKRALTQPRVLGRPSNAKR